MRGSVLPKCLLVIALSAFAQVQPQHTASGAAEAKPKIQVNFLNPCRPTPAELEEMGRALDRVKERPRFAADFEVARGVTTLTEAQARATGAPADARPSSWVRLRHEFPEKALLSDAQYSLSFQANASSETLALHLRNSNPVLQITISDAVTGTAMQAVEANTPPERIRIERYGKSSLVLARCPEMDQSAYEPLFQAAGEILKKYRAAMAVRTVVPAELARLPGGQEAGGKQSKAAETNH